jgi:putative ABC transport system substrate-binding protein
MSGTEERRRPMRACTSRGLALILWAALGALWPIAAAAQPAERVRHIGVLWNGGEQTRFGFGDAFEAGLRDHGWIKGRNAAVAYRNSGGRPERLPGLAAELVALRPEVVVAHTNPAIAAIKGVTTTIPIVMVIAVDPVGAGFVRSLARPAGNVTGLTFDVGQDIWGKRLELLREAAPGVTRVAVLWNPGYPPNRDRWTAVDEAARKLGVALLSVEVRAGGDLESRLALVARERIRGLYVLGDPVLFGLRSQIAELALKHRLPSVSPYREAADAGGLIAYGVSLPGTFRHAAQYVDRILKGARPGDLPVEQPTSFELVVNLKTANALELQIPPSLAQRVDQFVQ